MIFYFVCVCVWLWCTAGGCKAFILLSSIGSTIHLVCVYDADYDLCFISSWSVVPWPASYNEIKITVPSIGPHKMKRLATFPCVHRWQLQWIILNTEKDLDCNCGPKLFKSFILFRFQNRFLFFLWIINSNCY